MSLESPLFLTHPHRSFGVDATAMGVDPDALDALPWSRAFHVMAELERGAIANPDEGRQVGHYWLRAPELAPEPAQAEAIRHTLAEVLAFAESVRTGELGVDGRRFTDLVHVGIGGSALGPQLVLDALLDAPSGGLTPWFVDNTDPDGVERVLRRLGERLDTSLVVVVSKSGGTAETANGARLVAEALSRRGCAPGPRTVAITQAGSALDRQAEEQRWLRRFPMWDWVGGRTSVTSAVGWVPAALCGVDVPSLMRGAAEMDTWTRRPKWRDNPAALLAGCLHVVGNGRGDRNLVVLPYADRLVLLSKYLQQLVMESLGKATNNRGELVHQGLTVYGNKGSTDQHAYVQQLRDGRDDFSALFVQVCSDGIGSRAEVAPGANAGDFLQGFLLGTRRALREQGRPSAVVTVPEVSAFELGGLVALFERVVGLYGALIEINPYHQPGVEAGKTAARAVLDLSAALRREVSADPRTAAVLARALGADPIEVFHVLERLAYDGRVTRAGRGPTATYRATA
ncbi:MAG: glucose-6-phosphate isomerase [Myxococcota bacterium]